MLRRLSPGLLCLSVLVAAEGEPPVADPLSTTDPGLHVESRGEQVYRSRDLDALLLVTRRQLGRSLREDEEPALRRLLAQILVEREDLLPLLDQLPGDLEPRAHEELVLDLLAYQPEPAPEAADPAPEQTAGETATTPAATSTPDPVAREDGPLPPTTDGVAPPSAEAPAAATTLAAPPVADDLIPLPPLQLSRRGGDGSTYRLALVVALQLGEADDRSQLLGKLPVLQDAFITTLHGLDEQAIASPDPSLLKRELGTAARNAVPGFTGTVLITSLSDPDLER